MADLPPVLKAAATLPLLDAALVLWLQRRELQRWDGKSSLPKLTGDPAAQIRQAIGALELERANAASGPTFDRVRIAHPDADTGSVKEAIERAVKLERDCGRYLTRSDAGLQEDAQRALAKARLDNPGFAETSYTAALQYLCTAFR